MNLEDMVNNTKRMIEEKESFINTYKNSSDPKKQEKVKEIQEEINMFKKQEEELVKKLNIRKEQESKLLKEHPKLAEWQSPQKSKELVSNHDKLQQFIKTTSEYAYSRKKEMKQELKTAWVGPLAVAGIFLVLGMLPAFLAPPPLPGEEKEEEAEEGEMSELMRLRQLRMGR